MKQNETLSNIRLNGDKIVFTDDELMEEMGDNHISTSVDTPMVPGAFDKSDDEKIAIIQDHFKAIMETLGLDLSDDSLKGTPKRVAKMYVKEIFSGLNPANKPSVALFDNKYKYNEMLVEKNISFYSNCEHHFVPIIGKAHLAYISNGRVIGLSKLNRLVEFYAKRPQVQERLTMQIAKELQKELGTEDVAIVIDAKHLCVASRGVEDDTSSTITSFYGGKFKEEKRKEEFLRYLELKTEF
ncbi:MAG: GTP cyclohydrolase I FolE [Sphingobacteriia bacterium 24-36-13]|jgi:GTP cyclohydrolase I|uniref:GTP cyclohydrolase I FolE n=1 Tax=Sediminibacterium sp. TaxID=1917865 RepID=UPI000BC46B5F|nr:GTP cyclohydrolase I FolE [Sediminibacterium sp.]OYY08783.1 MAG: GTP cyclohydrolase I FolE [Sphingobacteriia bacterium 35-36-14]OYZ53384.1 MAG: GTP cyclohydrolase I FolE [Sphingobacteriia bacterium 24-36-13]OZA65053.1 MAG: GTP cyclohydrolase I FolE [Sphingobacteriia bacterium 39-36-14]HQS25529.1 GTP cyclohydrolase I FolE [Sediminibacterium sp.]HQS35188.1 GTP cyclohydrolase I FolE [Sediminibacterium sp.]